MQAPRVRSSGLAVSGEAHGRREGRSTPLADTRHVCEMWFARPLGAHAELPGDCGGTEARYGLRPVGCLPVLRLWAVLPGAPGSREPPPGSGCRHCYAVFTELRAVRCDVSLVFALSCCVVPLVPPRVVDGMVDDVVVPAVTVLAIVVVAGPAMVNCCVSPPVVTCCCRHGCYAVMADAVAAVVLVAELAVLTCRGSLPMVT